MQVSVQSNTPHVAKEIPDNPSPLFIAHNELYTNMNKFYCGSANFLHVLELVRYYYGTALL
jgi:hypothetical protein